MIEPGQTLLHYRLVEKIGEGGMGVVWKATDTTLNRDVAVKILPDAFLQDAERLARFEREARLLAALNHANIAGIYGTHEVSGCRFLVMELVGGEELAARLARGAVQRDEALRIALDVARGLEAAHEKGVIHRDLKPANIKLTGEGAVKVLDFGLAKALSPDASGDSASVSMSPTITSTGTIAGMILGTASYMSPEQAKGKAVDRRADIWSFGVVLFEMLSGRRVFQGETVSETLAAVMMQDIDWGVLPADTPPSVRRLLQRCLQRDPRSRLRDIGDARIALEETLHAPDVDKTEGDETTAATPSPWRTAVPWLVAVAALLLAAVAWFGPRSGGRELSVMRVMLSMEEGQEIAGTFLPAVAVSPDGNRVVFVGRGEQSSQLYVRHLDQTRAVPLAGTEFAVNPIFSPDGKWIAFAQQGKLKKIPALGGPAMTLCDAPQMRGATWGSGGVIVFAPDRDTGLMQVPDAGGLAEPLTTVEGIGEGAVNPSHRWPDFLPDGKTVLFTSTLNDSDYTEAEIVAVSLESGEQTVIVKGGTFGRFAPGGFLVFTRTDTMFAARFDSRRLELTGPAVPVLEGLAFGPTYGVARFSFSASGLLAYGTRSDYAEARGLVWLDRDGLETPASEHANPYRDVAVSRDGTRAALAVGEPTKTNIWLLDFERDNLTRLTFSEQIDNAPLWSPDGEWIVYSSFGDRASLNLFRKRSNGTGEPERLTTNLLHHYARSWSPDGKIIAVEEVGSERATDVMLLRLDPEPRLEAFLQTPFDEERPAISPDGRWIAYDSDASGEYEVYVRPLSGNGGQTKISTNGGYSPRWSPGGSEILYLGDNQEMMSVRCSTEGNAFRPQVPERLFDLDDDSGNYAMAPDGFRILTSKALGERRGAARWPTIVINWFDELEQKVPVAP